MPDPKPDGWSPRELVRKRRRRRLLLLTAVLLGLPLLYLVEERLRGEWLLAACKKDLAARGEKLTIAELTPPPPTGTNVRVLTVGQVSKLLEVGSPPLRGFPSPLTDPPPGTAVVFAQGERWKARDRTVHSWEDYLSESEEVRAKLPELRRQLTNGVIHVRDEQDPAGLYFSSSTVRDPHIALLQATLYALREGDLPGALENLHAGARLDVLLSRGQFWAWQSLRSIGVELTSKVIWQALQSEGWSDARLALLQHDWEGKEFTPATTAALRAGRALSLSAFPGGEEYDPDSYGTLFRPSGFGFLEPLNEIPGLEAWVERYGEVGAFSRRTCWAGIWSREDQCRFMLAMQELVDLAEHAWQRQVLAPICDLIQNRTNLVGGPLLLNERGAPGSRGLRTFGSDLFLMNLCPPNIFLRPALADTWTRLAVTAIALKRHELRHGALPESLDSLVPEFLEAVPIDPMDGQPVRYRRREQGGFLLYSVGYDGIDQGGDPTVVGVNSTIGPAPRDLVWPSPAPEEPAAENEAGDASPAP